MPPGEQASDRGLSQYLRVLRRRKGIVATVVIVVVCSALAVSLLQTPIYAATVKVLVSPVVTQSPFDSNGNRQVADPQRALQTQVEVFASSPVKDAVRKEVGSAPRVSVTPVVDADVLRVRAESPDAKKAAALANAYADAYIDVRRQQAVEDTQAAVNQIKGKVGELQTQIQQLDQQVADASPGQRDALRQTMAPQKNVLLAQQSLFNQRFDQLQVEAALQTGGAKLVAPATVPSSPARPQPIRTGVLALAVGLIVGCGLALLVDHFDDTVKTKEDVERAAPRVPVIGLIPASDGRPGPLDVESITQPTSPPAEAYRTLRTSTQFLSLEHEMRTLQVTSPSAQEGKTTTVANLGVALARAGHSVVMVCCDLRRPRVHEFFGLDNTVGFTSVLLGMVPLSTALERVPGERQLSLLASGPVPPNPSELLSSRRTEEILSTLQDEFDVVLIDSPPVLPVTDAIILSGRVDATVLVCVAGLTTRKQLARAVELLEQVNAPLVGTVLGGLSGEGAFSGSYHYYGAATTEGSGSSSGRESGGDRGRRERRSSPVA